MDIIFLQDCTKDLMRKLNSKNKDLDNQGEISY